MCVSLKDSQCSQKRPHAGNCPGPRVVLPLPPPPTCQSCSGLRAAREPQGHRAAPWTRPARPGAHSRHGDALVGTAGQLRGSGLSSQASAGAGPTLGSTAPRTRLTRRAAGVGPATVAMATERPVPRAISWAMGLGSPESLRGWAVCVAGGQVPGVEGPGPVRQMSHALTWPLLGDRQRRPGGEELVLGGPRLLSWGS